MHHTQMSKQESQALRCLIDLHVAKNQKYLKSIGYRSETSREAQKNETVNFLKFMYRLQEQSKTITLKNISFEHLKVFNRDGDSIDVHLLGQTISYDSPQDDEDFTREYAITTPEERQVAVDHLLDIIPRELPKSVGFDSKGG